MGATGRNLNGIAIHDGIIHTARNVNPSYDNMFHFFDELILKEMKLIGCETWIAGGALREYFLNKKITTDIDLYFTNDKNFDLAKNWLLNPNFQPIDVIMKHVTSISEAKKAQVVRAVVNRPIGKIVLENESAIKLQYNDVKIDLVKKYRTDPVITIKDFDFTVTMAAIDFNKFYCASSYFIDLINRDLVINSYHHPFSTFQRLQKYIKNGFSIDRANMLELATQIKNTPISEINPVEFMLDKLENPNGVVEVNAPIKQRKQQQAIGSSGTSGYGYGQQRVEIVQQEPEPEPEPLQAEDRTILQRIISLLPNVNSTPREYDDGY